jgi:thiol-disulfide isomerase/thioredoxin
MRKYLLILSLLCLPFFAFSQKINLITIDQLNNRIKNGEDTTYIINFWATWCVPCVKEMPALEKFEQNFKTEKIKLLLISVNFRSELSTAVLPFVKSQNIKSEIFLLDEKDPQEYIDRIDSSWSGAIPSTLFIKNEKRIFFEKDLTYDDIVKEYALLK